MITNVVKLEKPQTMEYKVFIGIQHPEHGWCPCAVRTGNVTARNLTEAHNKIGKAYGIDGGIERSIEL